MAPPFTLAVGRHESWMWNVVKCRLMQTPPGNKNALEALSSKFGYRKTACSVQAAFNFSKSAPKAFETPGLVLCKTTQCQHICRQSQWYEIEFSAKSVMWIPPVDNVWSWQNLGSCAMCHKQISYETLRILMANLDRWKRILNILNIERDPPKISKIVLQYNIVYIMFSCIHMFRMLYVVFEEECFQC